MTGTILSFWLSLAAAASFTETASSGPVRAELRGAYESARVTITRGGRRQEFRLDAGAYFILDVDDYNLDGQPDVQLHHDCGPTGSCDATVWLYDSARKTFREVPDYSGYPGLDVDPERQRVYRDRWWGAMRYGFRETYRVVDGTLSLVAREDVREGWGKNPDVRTERLYANGRLVWSRSRVVDWEKEPDPAAP